MAQDWYKPPATDIATDSPEPWQPDAADTVGFWPRAGARLVDAVVAFLLGMAAGFAIEKLTEAGIVLPRASVSFAGSLLFATLLSAVQDTVAEGIGGATIGKLVLGIRVRSESGGPISFGAAFKRALAYFWDSFFFAIVAYQSMKRSPLHQRVGDRWAGTVVVRVHSIPESWRGGARASLGALVGLALALVYDLVIQTGATN